LARCRDRPNLANELLRKRDIDDYEYVDWLYGT
jgi:hypothetical protein